MNPWQVLGIPLNSPPNIIKSAYRKLARLNHPDLGGDVATMQAINIAYDSLTSGDEVRYSPKPLSEAMKMIDGLIAVQSESGFKRGWVAYAFTTTANYLSTTLDDWEYLANRLGYSPAWAKVKFKRIK